MNKNQDELYDKALKWLNNTNSLHNPSANTTSLEKPNVNTNLLSHQNASTNSLSYPSDTITSLYNPGMNINSQHHPSVDTASLYNHSINTTSLYNPSINSNFQHYSNVNTTALYNPGLNTNSVYNPTINTKSLENSSINANPLQNPSVNANLLQNSSVNPTSKQNLGINTNLQHDNPKTKTNSLHNPSAKHQLELYPEEISELFQVDEDGILTHKTYREIQMYHDSVGMRTWTEPISEYFWNRVEKIQKIHDFRRIKKLKILAIDSKEEHIAPVMMKVRQVFPKLKYLEISFTERTNKSGIQMLALQISHLFPGLEEFSLKLNAWESVDFKKFNLFATVIGIGLSNLQRFSLAIPVVEGKEAEIQSFLLKFSSYAVKLTSLNLSIRGSLEEEENIVKIASLIVKRFPNLQALGFEYSASRSRVTDEGFVTMTNEITTKLKNLTSLSLSFPGQTQNIKKSPNKNYSCFHIRDQGLERISQLIKANAPNLQSLSLSFPHCDEITPFGLGSIGICLLPYLKSLKQLSLNFTNVGKLTDKSFTDLMEYICTYSQNLEKLDLKFGSCWRITGELWGSTAGQLLVKLSKLKELSLDFEKNSFSDFTFNQLCEGIQKSANQLNKLRLNVKEEKKLRVIAMNKNSYL